MELLDQYCFLILRCGVNIRGLEGYIIAIGHTQSKECKIRSLPYLNLHVLILPGGAYNTRAHYAWYISGLNKSGSRNTFKATNGARVPRGEFASAPGECCPTDGGGFAYING